MANEIVSEIILNLDTFKAQLQEAEKAGGDSGGRAGKALGDGVEKGFEGGAEKLKHVFLELAAAFAAAFAFEKVIHAAMEADAAMQGFNAALAANNAYTAEASLKFNDFAESLQKTTTASAELITKNASLLVSMAGLTGDGLERATKASLELAAGLHIDVDTAFRMVAKSAEGSNSAFQRYGIRIKETGTDAGNFAAALGVIEQRFNGLAEAQTKTFGGAMQQAENNLHQLLATLGQMVTQSPLVIGVIKEISKYMEAFTESLKEMSGGGDFIGNLIRNLVGIGAAITQYVIPPFELLYNVGNTVFNVLVTGVQTMMLGLTMAVQGLVEIGALVSDKFNGIRDTMRAAVSDQQNVLADMANNTVKSLGNILDFGATAKTQSFLDDMDKFVNSFGQHMNKMADQVGPPIENMKKKMIEFQNTMRSVMLQGMTTIVSGSVQSLATSLVKGGNAFDAFKSFALNALGDMSIRMGETMVAQSAAFQAMAVLIANPFTAAGASLAFGLALIALGAVLKAAAGGGGASAGGAGGGVASAGGGGGGIAAAPGSSTQQTAAQPAPQTNVQVVVQGNILDRRESGLEIANIINETFRNNGVVVAGGKL